MHAHLYVCVCVCVCAAISFTYIFMRTHPNMMSLHCKKKKACSRAAIQMTRQMTTPADRIQHAHIHASIHNLTRARNPQTLTGARVTTHTNTRILTQQTQTQTHTNQASTPMPAIAIPANEPLSPNHHGGLVQPCTPNGQNGPAPSPPLSSNSVSGLMGDGWVFHPFFVETSFIATSYIYTYIYIYIYIYIF